MSPSLERNVEKQDSLEAHFHLKGGKTWKIIIMASKVKIMRRLVRIMRLKSLHFEIKSQLSQKVTKPKLRDKVNITR